MLIAGIEIQVSGFLKSQIFPKIGVFCRGSGFRSASATRKVKSAKIASMAATGARSSPNAAGRRNGKHQRQSSTHSGANRTCTNRGWRRELDVGSRSISSSDSLGLLRAGMLQWSLYKRRPQLPRSRNRSITSNSSGLQSYPSCVSTLLRWSIALAPLARSFSESRVCSSFLTM